MRKLFPIPMTKSKRHITVTFCSRQSLCFRTLLNYTACYERILKMMMRGVPKAETLLEKILPLPPPGGGQSP